MAFQVVPAVRVLDYISHRMTQPVIRVCSKDARVVSVERPCREHVAIRIESEAIPPSNPGQFLQLRCSADSDNPSRVVAWEEGEFPVLDNPVWSDHETFLRRPFSIADRSNDHCGRSQLEVISRAIGRGTRWLDRLQAGDLLNITGPLGRGFELPAPEQPTILVGGGVGIPPLLYLSRRLHARGVRQVVAILGATTHDLLPVRVIVDPATDGTPTRCVVLRGDAQYPAVVTTDDGTLGLHGRVTDGLDRLLARDDSFHGSLVYACGPEGMLRSIAAQTRRLGLDCQLCIERTMGCGLGTCLSCVTRIGEPTRPAGWRWGLSCTEGPVFPRDALLDYDGV